VCPYKAITQTEWRLSEDGKTLRFARYGLMPSGEMKEIGEVLLEKLPAGNSCR